MPHHKIALLGFGNVGQALARLLLEKQDQLQRLYKITFSVTAIATKNHGTAINPDGLSLQQALNLMQSDRGSTADLRALSTKPSPRNSLEFIRYCEANLLFENTPVNYHTGQPAINHLRTALALNMHAITANKGPVVHAYRELSDLAQSRDRHFYFESSVMDGAPIFSLFRETLPAAHLISFNGILNSTTNLVLGRMEKGESLQQAISYAQSIGIAERDPSGDIDGWDAAIKVAALATVLMGIPHKPSDVDKKGIRGLSQDDVANALSEGKRWKLVCKAERSGRKVVSRVVPEKVSPESALYHVDGTSSIIQFESDVLGTLTITENDPGPSTTAYGLLADFINAVRD